ncbi:RNA 2',3'-cyclic phosphodiesterase [Methanolobus mangrovi]|uniref:RNA 2',3'-cyclic phosphodiesterase n=1 Tax=Methanolobus mangrovi TaxID=3072977 RepID=A0AA51UDN9_9EURY|nr:RNA 2',3'-cyclic phosphodiesterase [Methanolobus mangrovi]WMW21299.1 RNA 2',3'-cyclic phosphodiesterase [Methanolobus mangrovi]
MRTFVAVDLPVELHDKIADIQSKFSDFKFKFVDSHIVHITMKFLGDIPDDKIPDISKALDSVKCEPFEAHVKGLGVFPKPKFAKVLWLGCDGNFDKLYDLINSSLSSFDFEHNIHRFSAHATLARVKYLPNKKKEEFLKLLEELADVDIGTMQVDAFKLKKSTLTPHGPVYETLHEVSLK